ncbi:MAG: M36 family metallopeptidase [Bacteroidota bacterium]
MLQTKISLCLLISLFFFSSLNAQQLAKPNRNPTSYLQSNYAKWNLKESDVKDIVIKNQYISTHNGVQHFYYQQRYEGIEIYNAIWGIHLASNGNVAYNAVNFVSDIEEKMIGNIPIVSANEALQLVAYTMQLNDLSTKLELTTDEPHYKVYKKNNDLDYDVQVKLHYYPFQEGNYKLSWQVDFAPKGSNAYWAVEVDATEGTIIHQSNLVQECAPYHLGGRTLPHNHAHHQMHFEESTTSNEIGPAYRVFPLPLESPNHGERELLFDPSDRAASPFGWHDIDGQEGAEFTTTRGNNTHTYFDAQANNEPDGDEPEVGDSLIFDFDFNPQASPTVNKNAALTQLFYTTNVVHDVMHYYGFDEAAGNFQENNYTDEGVAGDFINAEALDGGGINNANFLTLVDGQQSRMQMFLWNRTSENRLIINSPSSIAGGIFAGGAGFGPSLDTAEVTAEVAIARDGSRNPILACETIVNGEEIAGKIAIVSRGDCSFKEKTLNVEAAGAVGIIVVNYNDQAIFLGGDTTAPNPIIPGVGIASSDGNRLFAALNTGERINATLTAPNTANNGLEIDGSFDNGVVVHEYGHGISTRLTGGAQTRSCLFNDEQMGEGWSDFYALALTTLADTEENRTRGIGTYSVRESTTSTGIRRQPYSPNLAFNNQTYVDIINTVQAPHPVGEIWATTLWDLYWALVDEYGFDEDVYLGNGGNNRAIQLVTDGLKLQRCSPGFLDGRDAILTADQLTYGGDNQCLIWEVFARRGLGFSAIQGITDDRKDGTQAFDIPPSCISTVKINKEVTPTVFPGDPIQVLLTIRNDKSTTVTNVEIQDLLPEGTQLLQNSLAQEVNFRLNGRTINLNVESLAPGEVRTIEYTLLSSPIIGSNELFFDGFEQPGFTWRRLAIEGASGWRRVLDTITQNTVYSVPSTIVENKHTLTLAVNVLVEGTFPAFKFKHNYSTEAINDFGIIEVSTNRGLTWETLEQNEFLRNGYSHTIPFNIFFAEEYGFSGINDTIFETYVNLNKYLGEEVRIRFTFESDQEPIDVDNQEPYDRGEGWWIDDVEFLNLSFLNTEACISTAQGDAACAAAPNIGTALESIENAVTNVDEIKEEALQLSAFPNPVKDNINLKVTALESGRLTMSLFQVNGQLVRQNQEDILNGFQLLNWEVGDIPAGVYWLKVETAQAVKTLKIVVQD